MHLISSEVITLSSPLGAVVISFKGQSGGSLVEGRIPEQAVGGSKPTSAVLCP